MKLQLVLSLLTILSSQFIPVLSQGPVTISFFNGAFCHGDDVKWRCTNLPNNSCCTSPSPAPSVLLSAQGLFRGAMRASDGTSCSGPNYAAQNRDVCLRADFGNVQSALYVAQAVRKREQQECVDPDEVVYHDDEGNERVVPIPKGKASEYVGAAVKRDFNGLNELVKRDAQDV